MAALGNVHTEIKEGGGESEEGAEEWKVKAEDG